MFLRKSDNHFPDYPSQDQLAKDPDNYCEVEGIEPDIDRATQRHGNWSIPDKEEVIDANKKVIGFKLVAYRSVIDMSQEEIDNRAREMWEDVRLVRNKYLVETDLKILKVLEEEVATLLSPSFDQLEFNDLRDYRQTLRDITDPTKNGGITDPSLIKIEKFSDA